MSRLPLPPNLATLAPLDLRDALAGLPQRRGPIGVQRAKHTQTIHYAGTLEPGATTDEAALAQIRSEARYHINKVWGYSDKARTQPIYGDGIMYHLAVLPSGRPAVMRELDAVLYHCANGLGNATSIAITTLRGIGQPITDVQWHGVEQLADALIADFGMGGREAVKGHREWPRDDGTPQSICPGPILFQKLLAYRDVGRDPAGLPHGIYQVVCDALSVRTGPSVAYPKANNDTLVYPKGRLFPVDAVLPDEGGMHRSWLHDATGSGFLAADAGLIRFVGAPS